MMFVEKHFAFGASQQSESRPQAWPVFLHVEIAPPEGGCPACTLAFSVRLPPKPKKVSVAPNPRPLLENMYIKKTAATAIAAATITTVDIGSP